MNRLQRAAAQRENLMELVQGRPGLHVRRIAQLAGIGWTTCDHHLRVLEAQDKLVRNRVRGKVCVFPTQTAGRQIDALLCDDRNRRIAATIMQNPGLPQWALAEAAGVSASSLCRRIRALETAGLVARIGYEGALHVHATPDLMATTPTEAVA